MTTQLSGQFDLFTATEATALSNTTEVANFSDPNLADTAGAFAATIVWGDGTTTTGMVVGSNGSFTVEGGHTYSSQGFFNATATITGAGDTPLVLGGTVEVTGNDQLTGHSAATITAAPNQALTNVQVATFTDDFANSPNTLDTAAVASDFVATIDWGDGTSSAGTLSGGSGVFTVDGSHTYATAGDFTITTFMDDIIPDQASGQATTQADIGFGGFVDIAAIENTVPTETVAIPSGIEIAAFVDNSGDPASDYTASIDWGDGTTTFGNNVSGSNGSFTVTSAAAHTYADEGNFTVTVGITRVDNNGTATASMSGTLAVADNDDFTNQAGTTLHGSPNQALTNVQVATFTDDFANNTHTLDTAAVAGDFVATIDWGDGLTSTGTVSGGSGVFTVDGSHTYSQAGQNTITVDIGEDPSDGEGTANDTATGTASIGLIAGTASDFNTAEGAAVNGQVVTFTDGNQADTTTSLMASIDWGDGITTGGTLTETVPGSFTVDGGHTYADEGQYTITTTVAKPSDGEQLSMMGSATISDADNFNVTVSAPNGGPGEAFNNFQVATFTDGYTGQVASDLAAVIAWGDGTSSSGVISGGGGFFTVDGSHTYAASGNYITTVSVADDAPGTATATASANGTVGIIAGSSFLLPPTAEGAVVPPQPIASFEAGEPAADLVASIDWGDGTTTSGSISPAGINSYDVISPVHTYVDEGTYALTTTITDTVDQAQATISGAAVITDADNFTFGVFAFNGNLEPGETVPLETSFTDAYTGQVASDLAATISWGDGTSSAGTITGGGGTFLLDGSHIYANGGSYSVTVTVADDPPGTATASAIATATINLAGQVVLTNATGGTALPDSTEVATFSDGTLTDTAADFMATINWGDGTTTTGTVSGGTGSFTVDGGHTYVDPGDDQLSVTLTQEVGGAAVSTVSGTVAVAEGNHLTPQTLTMTPNAGQASITATFSDTETLSPATDFTATISWGDGTVTTGTVSGGNGAFTVNGLHTYATAAPETVTVTLADNPPGTAAASESLNVSGIPVVTAVSPSVNASASQTFTPAQLFTASDAEAAPITGYEVEDESSGPNQGFWVLNGAVLPSGQVTTLTGAQLSELSFVAGSASTPVTDTLEVAATDAAGTSPFATFTVTASAHAPAAAPTVTAANVQDAPDLTLAASSLFSATASGGNAIVSYEVEDTTFHSGAWVFNGTVEQVGQLVDVTPAQLSELSFLTGYGTDTLMVRANDGNQWSNFTTFTVSLPPNAAPPAGTADTLAIVRGTDGAFEFYDIGRNAILLDGPLGEIDPTLQVAGVGGFNGSDTADLLMRDPTTGAFTLYDVSNNNITGNVTLGQVGTDWQVAGFGDFSGHAGETDMLLRNSNSGVFEVYDIANNAITFATSIGQVGLNWTVAGFGDFSGHAGETGDMLLRNSNTGAFEVYDISNNAITSSASMGQVGLAWQVAGFGDFSGNANETDMLMRNTTTGAFEVYDISNNAIVSSASMGQVGLEWTIAGFGDFSGNANETDMLMRDSNTGAFEIFDISHNTITSSASMGQVGLEWSISGIAAGGASSPPAAQLSGPTDDPASATTTSSATAQLTQAMASFAPSADAAMTPSPIAQTTATSNTTNQLVAPAAIDRTFG